MDEASWLTCNEPAKMLTFLQHGLTPFLGVSMGPLPSASDRKLRLYAVACCRQVWDLLTDSAPCERCDGDGLSTGPPECRPCRYCSGIGRVNRSRRAVEVAERYVDGLATEEELRQAREDAFRASPHRRGSPETAAHDASCMWPQNGDYGCADAPTQAALLRDIVGCPWRPVGAKITESDVWICLCGVVFRSEDKSRTFEPCECGKWQWRQRTELDEWLTWEGGTVRKLAESIYQERAFDRMPILADALEEAGCTDETILAHCRGVEWCQKCLGSCKLTNHIFDEDGELTKHSTWRCECESGWMPLRGPHVRGCWCLDICIGRS